MAIKQISYKLKDIDQKTGVVIAYANAYNVEDSDEDVSMPGSFNKTVKENFKRIRVLKDHNPREMIGVPLEIDPKDEFGLLTTTQFNMKKELGRDMFTDVELMYDNGLNAELSIGYQIIKRNPKNRKQVKEYSLYEYSFLSSWGANKLSTVQGIKGLKTKSAIIELIEKSYNLDYSDERLRNIENLLIKIDTQEDKPTPDVTHKDFEPLSISINNLTL